MKLLFTFGLALFIFAGTGKTDASSKAVSSVSDTVIYSIPSSYKAKMAQIDAEQKMEISSYRETLDLFDELGYTPEAWQAGIREIPRVYLVDVGERWGSETSKNITVLLKKRLFFRGLAPLILYANEQILKDRKHLEKIIESNRAGSDISESDMRWLQKAADLYKVDKRTQKEIDDKLHVVCLYFHRRVLQSGEHVCLDILLALLRERRIVFTCEKRV